MYLDEHWRAQILLKWSNIMHIFNQLKICDLMSYFIVSKLLSICVYVFFK